MPIWALGDAIPQVSPRAWVHPSAQVIGNVLIGDHASIWPGAVLRADFGSIEIGENSSIQDNCVLHPGERMPTSVGRSCIVGHAVHLEGVLIEDFVLVGSGAIVLDGARVRTGAMVAAGAVVLGGSDVPAGKRAQGVPAELVPHTGTSAQASKGAETYRRMARRYAEQMRRLDYGEPKGQAMDDHEDQPASEENMRDTEAKE
jgi:carbonic anhydrase/acetyltransferase-like protein (isoleucine patch superfamily)